MIDLQSWDSLATSVVSFSMLIPRIAATFLVLPLLTQKIVPGLVRNAIVVSLALSLLPLYTQTVDFVQSIHATDWPLFLMKEVFIGSLLGFFFGVVFWALGTAGSFIDTQTGNTMAMIVDPILGHQSSPNSRWLTQFASVLLVATGVFNVVLDVLFSSYLFWPVTTLLPSFSLALLDVVIAQFGLLMTKALVIAGPVMILLALVDWCFGFINRFAQQINLLSITMPIKNWLSVFILLMLLGSIAEMVVKQIVEQADLLMKLSELWHPL